MILEAIKERLTEEWKCLECDICGEHMDVTWLSPEEVWALTNEPIEYTTHIILHGDTLVLTATDGYRFRGHTRFDLNASDSIDRLLTAIGWWIEDNGEDVEVDEDD